MENYQIEFEIDEPKLISVNDQYIHPVIRTKKGKYVSHFAKAPYLKEVQSYYKEVLKEKISDDQVKKLQSIVSCSDKRIGVRLEIVFGMPVSHLTQYDASNYIKALEDCIVSRTGIDDSHHHEVSVEKRVEESKDKWIMKIILSAFEVINY